jgi:hypothetical protein
VQPDVLVDIDPEALARGSDGSDAQLNIRWAPNDVREMATPRLQL